MFSPDGFYDNLPSLPGGVLAVFSSMRAAEADIPPSGRCRFWRGSES